MKVNGKFHMKKIFAWAIASMAILANLAFLSLPNVAHAACSYTVTFSERTGRTSFTPQDTLEFSVKVTRGGVESDCSKTAAANIYIKSSRGASIADYGKIYEVTSTGTKNFSVIAGQGSVALFNTGLDLSSFDRAILRTPNVVEAFARVGLDKDNDGAVDTFVYSPNIVTLNISGSVGGSGQLKANVYFKDGTTYQEKSAFKAEEKMQILIQANSTDIRALDKSIGNIYAGIYINDLTEPVAGISASVADWASKTQVKQVLVIPENNFKDGTNNIQVKFFQANTDISLGVSSATVQASGMGTPQGPGTPGKTTNPGDLPQTQNPGDQPGGEADPTLNETLYNPLPTDSLTGTILTIAKGFLAIVALWAVVFIIIGGFRMVLSQGNEEAYLAAKKTITWAVLGVVVAMLSFSIIAIVQSLLGVTVPDFPDSQTPVVKNQETNQ